jgi:methionyl-tRNA formyltransferase
MNRRIVILTRGGAPVRRLLERLDARGARPAAVLVYVDAPARERTPATALRRVAEPLLLPLRRLRRRLEAWRVARSLAGPARVRVTGPLNGREMENDLRRLAPDVLLLAGCGLLGGAILSIPREGTVNVHPGLLPWIRGNGAVENAVLRGIPIGCTTHWVDAGIDTGRIIARRLARLAGGEGRAELRRAAGDLWVEMMTDAGAAAAAGPLPAGTPQGDRHPLCREVTDAADLAAVDASAVAGMPQSALGRWAAHCDPADLSLPPGAEARAELPVSAAMPVETR